MADPPPDQYVPTAEPATVRLRVPPFLAHSAFQTLIGVVCGLLGFSPVVLILCSALLAFTWWQKPLLPRNRRLGAALVFVISLPVLFWIRNESENKLHLPTTNQLATLIRQSAGELQIHGLHILGNPNFNFLDQRGGKTVIDNFNIQTDEAATKLEPSMFSDYLYGQLRNAAALQSNTLRSLAQKYKVPENVEDFSRRYLEAQTQARSEYARTLAPSTKSLAVEMEHRAGLSGATIPHTGPSGDLRFVHIHIGRMDVIVKELAAPENAGYAADYLDYLAESLPSN
jgi:hypothetical protein